MFNKNHLYFNVSNLYQWISSQSLLPTQENPQAHIHQIGHMSVCFDMDTSIEPVRDPQVQSVSLVYLVPGRIGCIQIKSPLVQKRETAEQEIKSQQEGHSVVVGSRSWIVAVLPSYPLPFCII